MSRSGTARVMVAAMAALLVACAPESDPESFALTNVTVVDAATGARPGLTVVVRGDRIVAVSETTTAPDVGRVIDGTGQYVIPGLWDMHVHLTYDHALTGAMPRLFLRWGVTSVRDTGGLLDALLPVVQAMRAEGALAPRVFFAGPLLDGERVVYDGVGRPEIGVSNPTADAARARVRSLAAAGVDFVKIYEMVSPEVFDAIVAAAEERGLPIAAHVPLSLRARFVAPRVNSMEHLRNVEMDCAADPERLLATRRGVLADANEAGADLRSRLHTLQRLPAIAAYDERECADVLAAMASTIQVPTLRLNAFALAPPFGTLDWYSALGDAPAELAGSWRAAGEAWRASPGEPDTTFASWSLRLVGWVHERGIPIGAGTDTPINYSLPGYALHRELEMLVRAGLTPLEALGAATVTPASFFGLEDEMGRIQPGMRADLALLDADPLADIANTRRIAAVVSRGRFFTRDDLSGPPR